MCIFISKAFVIVGLGMCFGGLILMIHARRQTTPNGTQFDNSHAVISQTKNRWGWFLTILGYLLQIMGVIIA